MTTFLTGIVGRDREQYVNLLRKSQDKLKKSLDATEEARARAERADKVKSAFLANMSHELRTPLNAVINFTRFVAKGDVGPVNTEQEDMLNEVIDSAKHLLNLINDVLDMSKIEAGSLNLFIEDNINLQDILKQAEIVAESLLLNKPVQLHIDISHDLPAIRADRQRIYQVILNILSNACKFTQQGSIWLRTDHVGDEVLLSVRDTGPGIAPQDQAMVFEAFKQTDAGLRQSGGTGLGMPISKTLIEAHGGRLWIESKLGEGATFFLSLPIKSQELVPFVVKMERAKS
jgi:signal transduction histidine kinase